MYNVPTPRYQQMPPMYNVPLARYQQMEPNYNVPIARYQQCHLCTMYLHLDINKWNLISMYL